ncbi:MAG: GNAT family N-acetyltransferase [Lachnospiraceae bacterium]|nr:GNAT family N-acetyltransferase [Lachnospiraceae bacterium]
MERAVRVKTGGILHITDNCVIARELKTQGEAVLVLLHGGNREKDFSFCTYAFDVPQEVVELNGKENADLNGQRLEEVSLEEICLDEAYLDRIYRRERRLPLDILETTRCLVRETTVTDVEAFYKIYEEPEITRYMEPLYDDPEEERAYAEDYIDKVYAFYDFGIWSVVEKESGAVIGRAGICYREGYEDPELGFVIGVPWQGKGFATEVCVAVLEYAWRELGFERVLAFVQPDNAISCRICEKIGMREEEQVCIQGQNYLLYAWRA